MASNAPKHLNSDAAQLFGPGGVEIYDDTDSHSGLWIAIHFRVDTVFADLQGNAMKGDFTGKTFLAGTTITNGCGFTKFDLTSGGILAYPG